MSLFCLHFSYVLVNLKIKFLHKTVSLWDKPRIQMRTFHSFVNIYEINTFMSLRVSTKTRIEKKVKKYSAYKFPYLQLLQILSLQVLRILRPIDTARLNKVFYLTRTKSISHWLPMTSFKVRTSLRNKKKLHVSVRKVCVWKRLGYERNFSLHLKILVSWQS